MSSNVEQPTSTRSLLWWLKSREKIALKHSWPHFETIGNQRWKRRGSRGKKKQPLNGDSEQRIEVSAEEGREAGAKLAEGNRQKAEKTRESADWEKNQSRIREYLETLSPTKRAELETATVMASPLGRGQISLRLRQSIIDHYVLDILDGQSKERSANE